MAKENESESALSEIKAAASKAMLLAKVSDHLIGIAKGLEVRAPEDRSRSEGQEAISFDGLNSFDIKAHTLIMSPMLTEEMAKELRSEIYVAFRTLSSNYRSKAKAALLLQPE